MRGERTGRQKSYHFLKRAARSPEEACCESREGHEESGEVEELRTEEGGSRRGRPGVEKSARNENRKGDEITPE